MDISQVGSYPPPYGGQSVHIRNLKDFLVSKGHECIVLNTGQSKAAQEERIVNVADGVDLLRKLWANRTDLIHVHLGGIGSFNKLYLCFAVSKICRRQTVVVTLHSGGFVEDVERLRPVRKRLLLHILRRVDLVIAVNEAIRDFLVREGVDKEKVSLIPAYSLSVDLTDVKVPESVETFLSEHDPVLSCMGFFEPQYGFDLAIQAVKSLKKTYPGTGLVIMASGERNGSLPPVAEDLDAEYVLVLKDMEKTACLKVLSRSSAFLRPTDYDGDAISVREAVAIGTPVVASSVGTRPEGTVLFKRGDGDELLSLLEKILSGDQPAAHREMRIEDEGNLESILDGYREAVKKTLFCGKTK